MMVPLGGGQILPTADVFKPPEVPPEAIERNNFVPYDFAAAKLKAAANDYNALKTSYDDFVVQLRSTHAQESQHAKAFYEAHIRDLKTKAKAHVESQKQIRLELEAALRRDIEAAERTIDGLRDTLADARNQHKEQVRALTADLKSLQGGEVQLLADLQDLRARQECHGVLLDLVGRAEGALTRQERAAEARRLSDEQAAAQDRADDAARAAAAVVARLAAEKEALARQGSDDLTRLAAEADSDAAARRECRAALELALGDVEAAGWADQRALLRTASAGLRAARTHVLVSGADS